MIIPTQTKPEANARRQAGVALRHTGLTVLISGDDGPIIRQRFVSAQIIGTRARTASDTLLDTVCCAGVKAHGAGDAGRLASFASILMCQ